MRPPGSLLARVLQVLLGLGALLAVGLIVSGWLERRFLLEVVGGGVTSRVMDEVAAEHAMRQGALALSSIVLGAVTSFVCLVWIYRTHQTARREGGLANSTSPGWAVGWFFVPVANLYKPYQAMCALWDHYVRKSETGLSEGRGLLRGWWALWLLWTGFGYLTWGGVGSGSHSPSPLDQNLLTIVADVTTLPLTLIFMTLVWRIEKGRRRLVGQTRSVADASSSTMAISVTRRP